MMQNEIYEEFETQYQGTKTSLTDWYIGSFSRAIEILSWINDSGAVATQFWTAKLDDTEIRMEFMRLWPDARFIDDVWIIPDVSLEWLRERGVRLTECVEITFTSRESQAAFIAETDHS